MADPIETFKKTFFDRKVVIDKVEAGIRRRLSGFGAYVRRVAQNSLKYGDRSSQPGMIPTVHRHHNFKRKGKGKNPKPGKPASPLKELIFFGYEPGPRSVVIGPVPFTGGNRQNPAAPELLEHGGDVVIKGQAKHYPGNPFMQPAMEKAIAQGKADFKGLVVR